MSSSGSLQAEGGRRRPRVLAVLPRGEAIRNFVYSGALDELARETDLAVVSVLPSPELATLLRERYPELHELTEVRERWLPRMLREVLENSHWRWLGSEAVKYRWRYHDTQANTPGKRLRRVVKKGLSLLLANRAGLGLLEAAEGLASRSLPASDAHLALLRQLRPDLVFNGSPVHGRIAIPLLHAARRLGIRTATFIFSWDNLTSQGRLIPPYGSVLVWNEAIRQQVRQLYPSIPASQVLVTGSPQFDFHFQDDLVWSREQLCEQLGIDSERPFVLYTTGMPNHMPGEPRLVAGIADAISAMPIATRPQLVVRIYAKDTSNRFAELQRTRADIVFPPVPWERAWQTPKLADLGLYSNLLRHCALGINVASTVSLELCMLGKPVINIAYNPPGIDVYPVDYPHYYRFDHYRPIVESGAVCLARSEQEMATLLTTLLADPASGAQLRQQLIDKMFGDTLDGRCGTRVAAALRDLAERAAAAPGSP